MEFDAKRFSTLDWVIVAGAVIAFIAAFLPWYGATVGPFSASVSGWSAGFSAWAGALLLTASGRARGAPPLGCLHVRGGPGRSVGVRRRSSPGSGCCS